MSRNFELENKISTSNVRASSTLAAGAVYQGTSEEVTKFGRAGISITSTNRSNGVLTIEVSRDGVTYGGPSRTISDARFTQPHMWNIVEKFFRIKYTNGTLAAEGLTIQVQFSNNADIILGHQLDETLIDETEAIITRSVLVGKTTAGVFQNVPLSIQGRLITEPNSDNTDSLLRELITELKIQTLHLAEITNQKITEKDVEE